VVNVTWNDAVAMAQWLCDQEGAVYRLPTEAEWEYAARAGTRSRFHTGEDPEELAPVANLFDQSSAVHWPQWCAHASSISDGVAFTAPVGQFAPNAFGLHERHGNAWEWCADW
jgi:sulfatase modifying factor 1